MGAQHPGQEETISGPKGNRPPPSWLPTFTKPCMVVWHNNAWGFTLEFRIEQKFGF